MLDQDVQCDPPGTPGIGPQTGRVLKSRDTAGFGTAVEYDALGRVIRTIPDNTVPPPPYGGATREAPTTVTFSPDLRRRSTVKRTSGAPADAGTEAYETLDGLGRLVLVQRRRADGTLSTQSMAYDGFDRVIRTSGWFDTMVPHAVVEGPDITTTSYSDSLGNPDPLRRPMHVAFPDGLWPRDFSYSGKTVKESVNGVNGTDLAETEWQYMPLGRLKDVNVPGEAADAYHEYDCLGNLVKVRLGDPGPGGQSRTWTYDGLGRLRSTFQPESRATSQMKYDAMGNLLSFVDADGQVHGRQYDQASRLTAAGEGLGTTFAATDILMYEYPYSGFSQGKLTYTITANGPSPAPAIHRQYNYDGLSGRLSQVLFGRYSDTSLMLDAEFAHGDLGEVDSIAYPHPTGQPSPLVLDYAYRYGMPVSVGVPSAPGRFVSNVAYDASGGIANLSLGNGLTETAEFDSRDRLSRLRVGLGGSVFDSGAYGYLWPCQLPSITFADPAFPLSA